MRILVSIRIPKSKPLPNCH